MAYVDLNPIRARMAKTPETSEHTSIKIRCGKAKTSVQPDNYDHQVKQLLPFTGNPRQAMPKGLPCCLTGYLELVGWTGHCIRDDKRGVIPRCLPRVLERLQIDPSIDLSRATL